MMVDVFSRSNSQELIDYLADSFREYCDFSYINFYSPSNELIEMSLYAKRKILKFCPNATFPNSYILLEFEVTPEYDGLASLIISEDFYDLFRIKADYASLIFRHHFDNTQSCVVNNFIYMTSRMPTLNDIWLPLHDLATIRIMGKDYVDDNDERRYQRAIALEKDLIEKGWNVDSILRDLLNSETNKQKLKRAFSYYYRYTFSNTIGYITPRE